MIGIGEHGVPTKAAFIDCGYGPCRRHRMIVGRNAGLVFITAIARREGWRQIGGKFYCPFDVEWAREDAKQRRGSQSRA